VEADSGDLDLPRGIALAWGIAANPQRGPKRELSIERIVEIAAELADENGLGAASMANVAATLGFTTMSLYRYVTAKDDLILLMQEFGLGLPPLTIAEAADWRSGLTAWYLEVRARYAAHPWLLDIPISGMPTTPNNLAWLDAGLSVLRDAPLNQQERTSAVLMMSGHARWEATITREYLERQKAGEDPNELDLARARIIGTFVTAEEFPALYDAVRAGVFTDEGDDPFEFALSRVLDGLERYMTELANGTAALRQVPKPAPVAAYPKDEGVKRARGLRREAEAKLRDARKKEQEAISKAREREQRDAEKTAREAEKAAAARRG
jgi:AcrR family transcriptional regulator